MPDGTTLSLPAIVEQHQQPILTDWIEQRLAAGGLRGDRISEGDLRDQSTRFFSALGDALKSGRLETIEGAAWVDVRGVLDEVSCSRAAGLLPVGHGITGADPHPHRRPIGSRYTDERRA